MQYGKKIKWKLDWLALVYSSNSCPFLTETIFKSFEKFLEDIPSNIYLCNINYQQFWIGLILNKFLLL